MNKIHRLDLKDLEECKYVVALTQEELNTIIVALGATCDTKLRKLSTAELCESYLLYDTLLPHIK